MPGSILKQTNSGKRRSIMEQTNFNKKWEVTAESINGSISTRFPHEPTREDIQYFCDKVLRGDHFRFDKFTVKVIWVKTD